MHGIRNLSQIVLCVGPFRKNVQEEKKKSDWHKKESLPFQTKKTTQTGVWWCRVGYSNHEEDKNKNWKMHIYMN